MTHTKRDFKSFLDHISPKPADTVVSIAAALESLSSTSAGAKTQVGDLHPRSLAQPTSIDELVATVCKLHTTARGSTVSLFQGSMLGRRLFAVSTYPERSVELTSPPTWQNTFAFTSLNLDVLVRPRSAVGSWFDRLRSVHVLDVVICVPDRRTAINFSRFFGQTSIYDLFLRREILIRPLNRQDRDAAYQQCDTGQNDCRRLRDFSALGTEG